MSKKILVVDDAKFMQMKIGHVLENQGYTIIGYASNGMEAYEKYVTLKPDAVTMDITMPEVNGLEGLKKIKEYDANAIVIMCSAMGQQYLVIQAIQLGAKDFIAKPFEDARIVETIKKHLGD